MEDAEDYQAFEAAVIVNYDAETIVQLELVLRFANVLWQLRRACAIETAVESITDRSESAAPDQIRTSPRDRKFVGAKSASSSRRRRTKYSVLFGMYVDAWFGEIRDIEIFSNVIHACRTAGLGLSVENGKSVDGIEIHNNLVFNNGGSGLYVSRWGVNKIRRNIDIYKNTFFHNGYAVPASGQAYFWMTGGYIFILLLYATFAS